MAQYMKAEANVKKICRWKCAYCHEENVGIANLNVTAQQSYGAIGTKKADAETNVKKAVVEETQKRIRKLNEEHKMPKGLMIAGKCKFCGKRQPWVGVTGYGLPKLILALPAGIGFGMLAVKLMEMIGIAGSLIAFAVMFFGAVFGGWAVWKGIGLLIEWVGLKMAGVSKEECYPVLLDPPGNAEAGQQ